MYTIRIEMFARAEPLVFTAEDLAQDFSEQMQELVESLEAVNAEEATDQVYERYCFDLCGVCRKRLHRGLKQKSRDTG